MAPKFFLHFSWQVAYHFTPHSRPISNLLFKLNSAFTYRHNKQNKFQKVVPMGNFYKDWPNLLQLSTLTPLSMQANSTKIFPATLPGWANTTKIIRFFSASHSSAVFCNVVKLLHPLPHLACFNFLNIFHHTLLIYHPLLCIFTKHL